MAKIKIFLYDGETQKQAESDLFKAMSHHVSGDVHNGEQFEDPMVTDAANIMEQRHKVMYSEMLEEIFQVLEGYYRCCNTHLMASLSMPNLQNRHLTGVSTWKYHAAVNPYV